jgi:hypothetical protein
MYWRRHVAIGSGCERPANTACCRRRLAGQLDSVAEAWPSGVDMTAAQEFVSSARKHLRSVLHLSREVLYSSAATLKTGPAYLLGHNPGGSPDRVGLPTIGSSLDALPTKTRNNYEDGWDGRSRDPRRSRSE